MVLSVFRVTPVEVPSAAWRLTVSLLMTVSAISLERPVHASPGRAPLSDFCTLHRKSTFSMHKQASQKKFFLSSLPARAAEKKHEIQAR